MGTSEDRIGDVGRMFLRMESLIEKLRLLKYEYEFCKARHQQPIVRHYFAVPLNPGEQFNTFTALAAWLVNKANGSIETPQEFDDPNAVVACVLEAARALGHKVDFAPGKLKRGWGECCVQILDQLAESALTVSQVGQNTTQTSSSSSKQLIEVGDEQLIGDDDEDEEEEVSQDDDSQEHQLIVECDPVQKFSYVNSLATSSIINRAKSTIIGDDQTGKFQSGIDRADSLISSSTNDSKREATNHSRGGGRRLKPILEASAQTDWQLEVERVLPHLRINLTARDEAKDWRSHLDQLRRLRIDVGKQLPEARKQLSRLRSELSSTLDKIKSREGYLNTKVESLLTEHSSLQSELSSFESSRSQLGNQLSDKTSQLTELNDELAKVKSAMDQFGSNMTDGSPVLRIKQAIQRLRSELTSTDIRIGLLEHALANASLQRYRREQLTSCQQQLDAPPFLSHLTTTGMNLNNVGSDDIAAAP